jgi:hypothetical protein
VDYGCGLAVTRLTLLQVCLCVSCQTWPISNDCGSRGQEAFASRLTLYPKPQTPNPKPIGGNRFSHQPKPQIPNTRPIGGIRFSPYLCTPCELPHFTRFHLFFQLDLLRLLLGLQNRKFVSLRLKNLSLLPRLAPSRFEIMSVVSFVDFTSRLHRPEIEGICFECRTMRRVHDELGSGLYLLLLIPLLLELTASFGYDYPLVLVLRRFMTRRFALVQSIGLSPVDRN